MSDTSPDFARYLLRLALVLAFGIVAVIVLVVVVDPYGLYRVFAPGRFNTIKPALTRYQEQIKPALAIKANPDFLILGNSRAEIGLDPKAEAFGRLRGKGYNLAIAGTGIWLTAEQIAQLKAAGIRPRTMIIGVEFLDFATTIVPAAATAAMPDPVAAPAVPFGPFDWHFDALFSLASVKDALLTLGIQHDNEAATMDLDGFNPLNEYRGHVREEGFHKIFTQRAQENARAFARKTKTALKPLALTSLDTTLDQALSMDADVKLVIYPYHAQILALFEEAKLWPLFEEWKRQVIKAVEQSKRAHPNANIVLLDFSGFGPYNCEPIPAAGATGDVTKWYWEGGHFKKQLGDIVLARVMSTVAPAPPFGFALDAGTEQANRERIAAERRTCIGIAPDTFASARAFMNQATPRN